MNTGSLARLALLLSVLLGCAAPARPLSPRPVASSDADTPAVAPNEAVITAHGFCPDTTAPPANPCDTIITRAQFDKLADALDPDMPRPLRLKVATSYIRMMRMAAVAEKRGLDKTAAFAEELRYARLQLLSQDLTRTLEEEARNVSDAEVADYYNRHQRDFEHATLDRIFVPGSKRAPEGSSASARNGEDLAELALALRHRAAAGESPEALQIEAFEAAGMEVADPHTKIEKVQRDSLPPSHESVMDLRAGGVSEVLSDPAGGHFIYKMITKDTPTLEELAPEIRKRISSQRYRESLQSFEGDVVFNDAYFDPPRAERASPPARRPHGARRSATR